MSASERPVSSTNSFDFFKEIRLAIVLSLLTLIVGLYFSYVKWQSAKDIAYHQSEIQFVKKFDEFTDGLTAKLSAYQQVLRATQGLFYASDSVSREEFRIFNQQLQLAETHPGIQGIGHAILIPAEVKDAHTRVIRAQGFPDYSITPVGKREMYSSIIYIEPFEKQNLRAFGFDMYSEPMRRKAMDLARETGKAVLSEKVLLVQDFPYSEAAGLLMYKPLFHEHLRMTEDFSPNKLYGWVYAVFRIEDLLKSLLMPINDMMSIRIIDEGASAGNQYLYGKEEANHQAAFNQSRRVVVASRTWEIQAVSTQAYESNIDLSSAHLVGWLGVLFSTLFALLVGVLAGGRANALRLAHKMTESLRLNERRLTLAKNASGIGIWDWDIVQGTLEWDGNMYRLYGMDSNKASISYAEWASCLHPEDLQRVQAAVDRALKGERAYETEFRIYLADGQVRMAKAAADVTFDENGNPVRMIGTNIDVTEEWLQKRELADSEAVLRNAVQSGGDGVWDWSISDGKVTFSEPLITMLGYTPEEFSPNLKEWSDRIHPDDVPVVARDVERLLQEPGYRYRNEHRLLCKDGSWKWILDRGMVISRDAAGKAVRAIGTHTDISQQKAIEEALRESEQRFRNSFETAAIGMALVSTEGRWLKVNHSLCAMLGYSEAELLQKTFQEITYKNDLEADLGYVQRLLDGEIDHYQMEKRYIRKSDELIYAMLNVSAVRDQHGKVIHFVSQIEDISARKSEDERIRAIAFFDPLTNLPNRRLFMERLHQAIARANRYKSKFAVMFMDVDYFKKINDTYGHDIGDKILKMVAERIQSCLRETDTASRFGGDEFVVMMDNVIKASSAVTVAENIRLRVAETMEVAGREFHVSLSIGVVIYQSQHGDDGASLLNKADKALYDVKAAGRNAVKLYVQKRPSARTHSPEQEQKENP